VDLARTILPALAGALLFERLKVPAGALIGAMVGVAAVNLMGLGTVTAPGWLRFAALASIGWVLGQQFDTDTLRTVRSALLPTLLVVTALMGTGLLLAWLLGLMGFDAPTAFLAASPGGISQMAIISAEVGADPVVVATVHLVRITAVLLSAPFLVRLFEG
jgi:membrane AbrB-like protein